MSGICGIIDIFPNKDLWRYKRSPEVTSRCGGLAAFHLVVILILIFVFRLIQVFRKDTIFSETRVQNRFTPPLTKLSTVQTNQTLTPFMFAFSLQQGNLTLEDLNITAFEVEKSRGININNANSTQINLEQCTKQHFSTFPELTQNFAKTNLNNWKCFPLNRIFEIGGNQFSSSPYKHIQIKITCDSNSSVCNGDAYFGSVLETFILNTFVNPTSNEEPFNHYVTTKNTLFQWNRKTKYFFDIDKNIMVTDNSLFPWTANSFWQGYQLTNPIQNINILQTQNGPSTTFFIRRSERTSNYFREFDSVLNALAFVGGLLGILLGLFIFMENYGWYAYDMEMAKQCFNSEQAKQKGFFAFLSTFIYDSLKRFDQQPDWKQTQRRSSVRKSITNLFDVVYLQRRIQYLENAISILLSRHQQKGLHLLHNRSKEEADENYLKYKARNQVLHYIQQKDKVQPQSENHLQRVIQPEVIDELRQNIGSNPMSERQLRQREEAGSQSDQENAIPDHEKKDISEWRVDDLEEQQMKKEHEIQNQLRKYIKKLLEEGQDPHVDQKSKKISDKINPQLKDKIKRIINQLQRVQNQNNENERQRADQRGQ